MENFKIEGRYLKLYYEFRAFTRCMKTAFYRPIGEHSGVSPLTGKKSKAKTTAAIKDHMLFCNHAVSPKNFKILASSNSEFHLKIKESLLISCDKSELNRNEKSFPLYLFD